MVCVGSNLKAQTSLGFYEMVCTSTTSEHFSIIHLQKNKKFWGFSAQRARVVSKRSSKKPILFKKETSDPADGCHSRNEAKSTAWTHCTQPKSPISHLSSWSSRLCGCCLNLCASPGEQPVKWRGETSWCSGWIYQPGF